MSIANLHTLECWQFQRMPGGYCVCVVPPSPVSASADSIGGCGVTRDSRSAVPTAAGDQRASVGHYWASTDIIAERNATIALLEMQVKHDYKIMESLEATIERKEEGWRQTSLAYVQLGKDNARLRAELNAAGDALDYAANLDETGDMARARDKARRAATEGQ